MDGDKPKRQKFKRYPIGFFHIDIAEVQTAELMGCPGRLERVQEEREPLRRRQLGPLHGLADVGLARATEVFEHRLDQLLARAEVVTQVVDADARGAGHLSHARPLRRRLHDMRCDLRDHLVALELVVRVLGSVGPHFRIFMARSHQEIHGPACNGEIPE